VERDFFDLANQVVGTLYSIRAMAQERPPQAATPAQQINVAHQRQQHTQTLAEMIDKLGWPPMLSSGGQVIQEGAGLLTEAAVAFAKAEEQLRPVHLHLVTQAFKAPGYASQRYAWPVLQQLSLDVARWALEIGECWADLTPKTLAKELRWRTMIDDCPASDELLEAIGWRLVQERDWLGLQPTPPPENKLEGEKQKRGGNNRNSNARQRVAMALAKACGYDPDGSSPRERIRNLTLITGQELAELAEVSHPLVSDWMKEKFGSQHRYSQLCRCASETGLRQLDEIFSQVMPKTKRSRTASAGELSFQAKTVAAPQLTEDEAFETARQHADENGFDISDDELRQKVRQTLRVL
jgi:hypothetical protein